MFGLFKKKEKSHWREFACYIDPFMRQSDLAVKVLQRANDLGLRGRKILVVSRQNVFDSRLDKIWFEGEE